MFVRVTSSFNKEVIWFDSDSFVALEQNLDEVTGRHISTDIYLSCGQDSLRFTVIDTPDDIIDTMRSGYLKRYSLI